MATETLDSPADAASFIKGRSVCCTGGLATMTLGDFEDLVVNHGGLYSLTLGVGTGILVVGQRHWPVGQTGKLPEKLRRARLLQRRRNSSLVILSEDQFMGALGVGSVNVHELFSLATLTETLQVSRERVRAWVRAGLVKPAKIEHGVWYFDFRQVAAAKTICDLARQGVSLGRVRRSLEHLRTWMPDVQEPLQQLAELEKYGRLLMRMEDGELAEPDGQFHFDFTDDPAPSPMRILPGPRTAWQWCEQGIEQEQAGFLDDAAESYRQSLLLGGPDAEICFDLANVLRAQGKRPQAVERYLQAVEIDPHYADAWNNLGTTLADLMRPEDACSAFRKAVASDPNHQRALYNLADTLEELGRIEEAAPYWQAYLRYDSVSPHAAYARLRLHVG